MGKSVLSPEEFSRIMASRLQQERPEAQVEMLGQSFLMLREEGRRKVFSLASYYRQYSKTPDEFEELVDRFLREAVYQERRRMPTLLEVRGRILPQMVPVALVEQTRRNGRDLAAVHYAGELAIAFVIDEAERYAYIHERLMMKWRVKETDLLALGVRNLQQISRDVRPLRIGRGKRLMLVWEAFDGYDASRILLTRSLCEAAAHVEGNPVIAIPHRDYLVMFGDSDPAFMEEMVERIKDEFSLHRYPISDKFYTLHFGALVQYDWNRNQERVVN